MRPPEVGPGRPFEGADPAEERPEGTDRGAIVPRPRLSMAAAPVAVGAREAALLVGLSLRTWRALDTCGGCPAPVRIGRRRLWPVAELQAWIAAGAPSRARWQVTREAAR